MVTTVSYLVKRFVGVALLLVSYSICLAQSHDPNKPTPLGPGVNKGNVDNKENGPNYYYFYAGPGLLDMKYAFKEMGVLGSPLRQSLSFDLYDEKNTLIAHDAIVSVDQMGRLSRPGKLDSRHRLVIRLISPDTTLRLGGYYEIEATGAATFDGKATGANVKPEDKALYRPGGALTGSQVPLTQGPVALTTGTAVSLYEPVGALTSVQQSPKELRLTLAADVLFDFDKSTIRLDARAALDRVAEIVRAQSHGTVEIEGFTDSKGGGGLQLAAIERPRGIGKRLDDRARRVARRGIRHARIRVDAPGRTEHQAGRQRRPGRTAEEPARGNRHSETRLKPPWLVRCIFLSETRSVSLDEPTQNQADREGAPDYSP